MTGRDFRAFITSHSEEREKLTLRTQALGNSKCQLSQYDRLQAMLEAKRISSLISEHKVRQMLSVAQVNKEKSVLRQHRQLWIQEHHRLNTARDKAEEDFHNILRGVVLEQEERAGVLSELMEYELQLQQEREDFRSATVEPIYQLRDDLKYRLTFQTSHFSSELEEILQQVFSVRQQQEELIDRLQCECVTLQQDISASEVKEQLMFAGTEDTVADLEKIPDEICTADCPYPDLKSDLIHSFCSLTEKYTSRLETAQIRLQGLDRNCGWNEADHECFQHISSLYSSALRNQHMYCTDMLRRALPHITAQELSAHKRCSDWYHFSMAQRRLVLQAWQRDRAELLTHALNALQESSVSRLQQQELQKQRFHQQHICFQLREKLQQFRAQQEEAAELEAVISARLHKEEEERLRKEQQRENKRRAQLTQQVNEFHIEQQRRREEQRKRDMERLVELRREMEIQKMKDKERVQLREEMLQQKLQKRDAKEKLKQEEEEMREERLQALRNKVCKIAEADPERMMGGTLAWKERQHPEEMFTLQRSLYQLNTYTDTQIVSDPRVRIEQALRTAGLHDTPYARQILSEMQPLKPPRRDMESTAFRS